MPSPNNIILIKRNDISGVTPTLSALELGELGLNVADGKLFTKTVVGTVTSIAPFSNDNDFPYTLNHYYSSVKFNYGNNTINQIFGSVLGGYENDITGGGSTVINGENNDIAGDFSLIGSGYVNQISANGDYSFIASGSGNLINHQNVFILGTDIKSHAPNFTYVNNISSDRYYYGDGRYLTHVGDRYYSTSNTTQTIQKAVLIFQLEENLSYTPTQDITIAYDINNHMHGTVLDYNTTTGLLTADITTKTGNGTHSSWYVNVGGTPSFLGALLNTNNLSDVFDASTALANLSGVSKTDFSLVSSNWQSTYTTVQSNSSSVWNYQGTDIKALTGDWINGNLAYTTIQSNSAAWNLDNFTDTEVRSLTSNWNSTYSTLSSLSSIWDNTTSTVQSQSATWGTSSNTTLISAVTSDVTVGGIDIAQIVPQNTTFQQFVETLLTKIYYPTITAPSASMSSSIGTNVEAGTEGITLTVNLNRGAITGKTVASIWDPNTLQDYRSGTATQYIILGVNNGTTSSYTSATVIIQEGTNTFNGSVTYATGPQPVDSKGQNYLSPLASNTIAVSTPVYGRRKAFYGVDNNAANSSNIRSLAGSLLNPSNGSTFTISIPIGTVNVVFAYPSSLRNVTSVLYQEGFDADVKGNFTSSTVSVEGTNSYTAITYKVYKYTPVTAFTQAATYNVTI